MSNFIYRLRISNMIFWKYWYPTHGLGKKEVKLFFLDSNYSL